MFKRTPLILGVLLLCCVQQQAWAGVTTVQQLQFGSYIVKKNDAVYTITVNIGGVTTYDPSGFIQISPGQDGIYDLDGMTPFDAITSVTITQVTPLAGPSGPNFQMNSFTETHPAQVDAGGVVRVRLGASADTSGSGMAYIDQTYTGQLLIQINF